MTDFINQKKIPEGSLVIKDFHIFIYIFCMYVCGFWGQGFSV